jgi:hypothetical protein
MALFPDTSPLLTTPGTLDIYLLFNSATFWVSGTTYSGSGFSKSFEFGAIRSK